MTIESWGYHLTGQRDLRLDFLRGFALFVMIVNHSTIYPSWLYLITGRGQFYISASEGFFFLSGMVLGVIAVRQELYTSIKRILRRAFQLYLAAIAMALTFCFLAIYTNLELWYGAQDLIPFGEKVNEFIIEIITLQESFHGSSILVLYVFLMLAAPLVVFACAKKKSWLVILICGLVYGLNQVYFYKFPLPVNTYLHPASWQMLFFSGVVIGYNRQQYSNTWKNYKHRRTITITILSLGFSFLILYIIQSHSDISFGKILGQRELLAWPRLFLVCIYLAAFFWIVNTFWQPLSLTLGWMFIPLGQNSLWSFVLHWFLIVIMINLPIFYPIMNPIIGMIWQIILVLIILLTISLRNILIKYIPRLFIVGLLIVLIFASFYFLNNQINNYKVDDRANSWQWINWKLERNPFAFRNTLHGGDDPEGQAIFQFQGRGIELYTWKGTQGGKITLSLDGQYSGTYNLKDLQGASYHQRIFDIQNLPPGKHVMTITPFGEGIIFIDYAIVYP